MYIDKAFSIFNVAKAPVYSAYPLLQSAKADCNRFAEWIIYCSWL
jgi:hypothetical protein